MKKKPKSFAERFWPKVNKDGSLPVNRPELGPCWLWMGATNHLGYGRVKPDDRTMSAHRAAYEMLSGPVPAGLELDHLCRQRNCVNPAHLEPVTHRENVMRAEGFPAMQARQTHCKRGHPFDDANTHVKRDGNRSCRACEVLYREEHAAEMRADMETYREENREELRAYARAYYWARRDERVAAMRARREKKRLENGGRRRARLTNDKVREIRGQHALGDSLTALAAQFGVHITTVFDVVHHKTWKETTE